MNIDKLERMVALYEARSFGKAAQLLGISQPALTWSIQQLEDELKVRLFNRGPRGIEPTRMCEKLIRRARVVLREQAGILTDVREESQSRLIVIGVHSGILNGAFAKSMDVFSQEFPGRTIRIVEGYSPYLVERLKNAELDFAYCAINSLRGSLEDFHIDPVQTINFSVVASKDHPVFEDLDARRVGRYPWAIFHSETTTESFPRDQASAMVEEAGYALASQEVRTSSMSLMRLLALKGQHLCLIADDLIADELASGELRRLPQTSTHEVTIGFVSLRGSYETPGVAELKNILREYADKK